VPTDSVRRLPLAVVVGRGASGLFGVRSTTTSTSAGGYTLAVTHASIARLGLVPWKVIVQRAGGYYFVHMADAVTRRCGPREFY
jgi:hypothetical protein